MIFLFISVAPQIPKGTKEDIIRNHANRINSVFRQNTPKITWQEKTRKRGIDRSMPLLKFWLPDLDSNQGPAD
jgi:hypothetical protein